MSITTPSMEEPLAGRTDAHDAPRPSRARPLRLALQRLATPAGFGWLALALIASTLVATSITQSRFIASSVLDDEARLVGEMVRTLAARELTVDDLRNEAAPESSARLERSFAVVRRLSGVVRLKAFRRDGTIVWSDEPRLVGTRLTAHHADMARALAGEARAVRNPPERALLDAAEDLPRRQLIEFYVPIYVGGPSGIQDAPQGVLAMYRLPDDLDRTTRNAVLLLWTVSGLGGIVLFFALRAVVRFTHGRQRQAERAFAALSGEHQRILQVEKLSAVGQTVTEIAHQINNPLVGVVNLAQLAEAEADDPARVRELLQEIRRAGLHCSEFVNRMLGFTQIARYQPQTVALATLLRELEMLLRQGGSSRLPGLAVRVPEEDVSIQLDPVLMQHALFNLVQNALQACPDGPVELAVRLTDGPAPTCGFVVTDAGPGVQRGFESRIFRPFFTTRSGGTGLGLPVVRLVAAWHGGEVRYQRREEGGACFVLSIPMVTP